MLRFTHWYNMEHKHSQLRFVTPHERHMGEDKVILAKCKQTIESAKALNPARWGSREVRDCTPVPPTTLNPVKELKSIDKMRVT